MDLSGKLQFTYQYVLFRFFSGDSFPSHSSYFHFITQLPQDAYYMSVTSASVIKHHFSHRFPILVLAVHLTMLNLGRDLQLVLFGQLRSLLFTRPAVYDNDEWREHSVHAVS